ncbi:MAG: hypothetical protein JNK67_19680 [Alphaproteobacteria bacterium]|nr:hypothetical protein [Alphaproteobacteria bacterium]
MAMFRKTEAELAVGDRFIEANREKTEWVVEFVFSDPNAVPHARMRKTDDATVQRTFAVAVLLSDPRFRRRQRAASA